MAFDKVKTLREAERFLELGKIPAAIKEYCQIVESEPNDFTMLNMLGDLYVRVGNHPAAISCFRRIAEHYREQDFALKAIAIYKKIDRLQPHDAEISTNLADLYAQQDLVIEARAHYLAVAEAHNRAGATREALEVLRKIADLDPQNTGIRTKLAEGYLKEGMITEAAACFREAGQHLVVRGAFDNALEAFDKALEILPDDRASLRGLLAAHSARGTADEAADVIERALTGNPDDVELLSMLASAYVAAKDPTKAERATASLLNKESSAYLRYIDVARVYLTNDKLEDAIRVVAGIAEQMLAEREENQLLELVNELLACGPDNVPALRLLVRVHWWQRDMEKLKTALETLAEAAKAGGLEQDERYALTHLTRLVPDQAPYVERLNQLGGAEEGAANEALPEFQTVPEPAPEEAPASEFTFESHSMSSLVGEAEFEWNPVGDVVEPSTEAGSETSVVGGFTFEAVVAEELASGSEAGMSDPGAGNESRHAAARAQELESVDFYIAQGYVDIALDTLDLLERQFGPHADIDVRRGQLQTLAETGQTATSDSQAMVEEGTLAHSKPESGPVSTTTARDFNTANEQALSAPAHQGIHPSLAEVFEEYRLSAESEANSGANGDYETHYNLGLAYKEMDLFEEALEEFQIAIAMVAPNDGTPRYLQCCNLLGHCFMQKGVPQLALRWFQKGLDAPGASEDERQALRYELGAAYEQAGDFDRALDIFTEVYGINVSYRGVNERLRALQARTGGKNGKVGPGHKRGKNKKQRFN
jgi:tetratricopeptide (TPR) repeat protein